MALAQFIEVRIEQGKLLLENQQLKVAEVAYAVGFDSLAYFYKSFKRYYGVSPSWGLGDFLFFMR
jgi:AraC-like DNA-binding protein